NVASPLASIVALVELFGSSNLVFGTNMPLNYPGASIAKTVGPLYSKPDREAICYGNAQKILFRQVKGA
ncbi:MAG TPA: amidohydrolase family protein, partial [Firmicutes bacterium]|nr:amidohydrolase family protein [Bacillota bacterium]